MTSTPPSNPAVRPREVLADAAVLSLVWILVAVLVDPVGEFPLNDDWACAITVQRLLENGTFRPHDWLSMTFLTQAVWGALVATLFGFSYTTLRFSTLFLGISCVIALYLLVREVGAGRAVALFAALVLAFNPLYLGLSYTFMTDVPFLTACIFALLLYVRFLRTGSKRDWGLGTFCVLAAVSTRQLGLFVPLGFALTLSLRRRFWNLRGVLYAVVPLLLAYWAQWGIRAWLEAHDALPAIYERQKPVILFHLWNHPTVGGRMLLDHVNAELLYVGLFLFPFLLLIPTEPSSRRSVIHPWIAAIASALSCATLFLRGRFMPLRGNILTQSGLGPSTLRDRYILDLPHEPRLPDAFWIAITIVAIVAAGLLLARVFRTAVDLLPDRGSTSAPWLNEARMFLLLTALVYAAVVSVFVQFDRYFLPIVPVAVAALIGLPGTQIAGGRFAWSAALAGLLGMAFFSVAGTHDYLAWNRARWAALHDLTDRDGVSPRRIDGGPEFNGIHLHDPNYQNRGDKSWWWVDDDEYVVARGPLDGYDIFRRYEFTRWMPFGPDEIVVLHRNGNRFGR